MRWDGFFHAAVCLLTLIGVYWLLTDARRGFPLPHGKAFTGLLIPRLGPTDHVRALDALAREIQHLEEH